MLIRACGSEIDTFQLQNPTPECGIRYSCERLSEYHQGGVRGNGVGEGSVAVTEDEIVHMAESGHVIFGENHEPVIVIEPGRGEHAFHTGA